MHKNTHFETQQYALLHSRPSAEGKGVYPSSYPSLYVTSSSIISHRPTETLTIRPCIKVSYRTSADAKYFKRRVFEDRMSHSYCNSATTVNFCRLFSSEKRLPLWKCAVGLHVYPTAAAEGKVIGNNRQKISEKQSHLLDKHTTHSINAPQKGTQ